MSAEEVKQNEAPEEEAEIYDDDSLMGQLRDWIRHYAGYWGMSFTFHMILLSIVLLVAGKSQIRKIQEDDQVVDSTPPEAQKEHEDYQLGDPDPDTSILDTDTLEQTEPPSQTEKYYDDSATFVEAGGGTTSAANASDNGGAGGPDIKAFGDGPKVSGNGGIGAGVGTSKDAGSGGDGSGFGSRGQGSRKAMLGSGGGTKHTERAVGAALDWLARHQDPKDGNWSLKDFTKQCRDKSCTGPGSEESLSAATAFGVLPFLAAGQTHVSKGRYQANIAKAIYWLLAHQKADGDMYYVPAGQLMQPHDWMYTHGLATIALCECAGMSGDATVKQHAQLAIDFIVKAQNKDTGGWRYTPGDPGDTSVVGWQLMALKSAQMAGLHVEQSALDGTKKWLASVQAPLGAAMPGGGNGGGANGGGNNNGGPNSYGSAAFEYQPNTAPSATMTAVAVLCHQYLHAGRGDPAVVGGVHTIMDNQPDGNANRNVYYWYYATQVMHNMADKDWDTWNRKMRKILVESQCRDGCASGSWDPDKPARDAWGQYGGRIMVTSLSCLTLEVYYRYLPLYKLDRPEEAPKVQQDDKAKGAGADKKADGGK